MSARGKVKMQLRNNTRKLGILFAACVLAGGLVSAQDQDFSKVQRKVTKVAGNIYTLEAAVRETLERPSATTASSSISTPG
jgi:hypothetical protein